MGKRIEYRKGDLIGELIYISELPKNKHGNRVAIFECSYCGKRFNTMLQSARTKNTKSCGCLNNRHKRGNVKHGLSNNRLYKKWKGIKRRCYNKNEDMYHVYGGKGISMCDEWLNDPKTFVNYCMTIEGWDDKSLTIDRVNSNGNYEPGNIRFASYTIQARNIGLQKNNKSGYTGVVAKGNRYVSVIGVNYHINNLGSYGTALEAAQARDQYIIDNNLEGFKIQAT